MRKRTPEEKRAAERAYYAANRERIMARNKARREANPEAYEVSWRKYNSEHREQHREASRRYGVKRRSDPVLRARDNARTAAWKATPEGAAKIKQNGIEQYAKLRADPRRVMLAKLRQARKRATTAGLAFDEALLILPAILPRNCASCGVTLEYQSRDRGHRSRAPSIDRVDNAGGYTVSNIAFICTRCNAIKSDATVTELRAIANYIDRHFDR